MHPIFHHYSRFGQIFTILFDISGFLVPLFILFSFLYQAFSNQFPISVEYIIGIFLFAFFAGLIFILTGHYFQDITSDSDGLHIHFLWMRLFVPWRDITDHRRLLFLPFPNKSWVILTRSLTLFHRLYGLFYAFSLAPCVVYSMAISDYDELNKRILVNLRKNKKSPKMKLARSK